MGEPGHTAVCVGSCPLHPASCLAWAYQWWAVGLSSSAQPRWRGADLCTERDCPELEFHTSFCSPAPVPPSATLSSSKDLGEVLWWWTNVQVPTAASATGSGWPAPGLCRNCVDSFCGLSERNSDVSSHVFLLSPGMRVGRAEDGGLIFRRRCHCSGL